MATQADYTAVANKLAASLQGDINAMVPSWARGMIPANEANILGGQLAKIAVDTLDAFRAMEKPGNTVKGNPFETGVDS
jgi:hypothetical protein